MTREEHKEEDIWDFLPSLTQLKVTVFVLGLILAALLAWIFTKPPDPNIVSKTSAHGSGTIYTIKHDGHWWVTKDSSRVTPVHHPDCPCGRLKP